ncbi:MAG: helix-turn-helix domain-containing protein [Gracilibacteraceae bacterium]|jgi:hypothetical protein|nr:helix-turn-helix domain-containing protein [Gracilibacteraceae bacterium]
MTLKEIALFLSDYQPVIIEYAPFSELRCLKFAAPNREGRGSDVQIGRCEDFINYGVPRHIKNIICIGDVSPLKKTIAEMGVNCLNIVCDADIFEISNKISEFITESLQLRECTNLMFDSARNPNFRDIEIDKVIDLAASLFCNPVALFSQKGEVIAFRNLADIFPDITTQFRFDFLADMFMDFLAQCDNNDGGKPVIRAGFMNKTQEVIVGGVTDAQGVIAYCAVFARTPFRNSEATLMSLVTSWLGQEVRRGRVVLNTKNTFAHKFLSALIESHIHDESVIAQGAETLKMGGKAYYYLIAVDTTSLNMSFGSPRSLDELLQRRVTNSISTVIDQYLILLLNSNHLFEQNAIPVGALDKLLSSVNVAAGVSFSFTDLKNAAAAFHQARLAIDIGKLFNPEGCVFFYTDCMIYNLISQTAAEQNILQMFCLPQLTNLLEYDQEHNTKYTYTLYILIVSDRKQTASAKALGIHRTTMQYRVEKIVELLGMDVNDHYNILRLYISFGVMIYKGILDPEKYYQI